MRIFFYVMMLLIINFNVKEQPTDYKSIRDNIVTFRCGKVDIDIVYQTKEKLLNINSSAISSNIFLYYKDIADCYYRIWGKTKDVEDAYLAIDFNKKSINKNKEYSTGYWDIALIYYFLGECNSGDNYWEQYKIEERTFRRRPGTNKTAARTL